MGVQSCFIKKGRNFVHPPLTMVNFVSLWLTIVDLGLPMSYCNIHHGLHCIMIFLYIVQHSVVVIEAKEHGFEEYFVEKQMTTH